MFTLNRADPGDLCRWEAKVYRNGAWMVTVGGLTRRRAIAKARRAVKRRRKIDWSMTSYQVDS